MSKILSKVSALSISIGAAFFLGLAFLVLVPIGVLTLLPFFGFVGGSGVVLLLEGSPSAPMEVSHNAVLLPAPEVTPRQSVPRAWRACKAALACAACCWMRPLTV